MKKQNRLVPLHPNAQRVLLEVFVSKHCWQCPEARALAKEMDCEFSAIAVRIIDLDQPGAHKPASVFAVPTFLLNGRTVSLGTPYRDALRRQIRIELDAMEGTPYEQRKNWLPSLK